MGDLVGLFLFKKEGIILLQHRTNDAPTWPDYWVLFGGHIEPGETPVKAVVRELLEEIGYYSRSPRLVLQEVSTDGLNYIFAEEYQGGELVLHEGQGFGWFTFDQVGQLKIPEHHRASINQVRSLLFRPKGVN